MKNKHFFSILSEVSKSKIKIIETKAKLIPITHKYMTVHFTGLVQALQLKKKGGGGGV